MRSNLASFRLCEMIPAAALLLGFGLVLTAPGELPVEGGRWQILVPAAALTLVAVPLLVLLLAPGSDAILVAVVGLLQAIGVVVLLLLANSPDPERAFFATVASRQLLFVLGGSVALIFGCVAARNIERIVAFPYTLLALALAPTIATMVFGRTVNGARLWLTVGPVTFQPSEVSRLLLASFIAAYLYDKRYLVAAPWRVWKASLPPAPYLLPLVAAIGGSIAVLIVQNDLGMAALVTIGALVAVSLSVRSGPLIGAGLALIVVAGIGSYAVVQRVQDRVAAWLDPWQDPASVGFQFIRAEYALAAGGLGGTLPAGSAVRIPEEHTDFVIAAAGGQAGWLVGIAILALFGILISRCALASLRAATTFQTLLALTAAVLIGVQCLLILGGSLRALPLTGLTVPLVSYGGTSMLSTLFALGVIVGIGSNSSRSHLGGMQHAPILTGRDGLLVHRGWYLHRRAQSKSPRIGGDAHDET